MTSYLLYMVSPIIIALFVAIITNESVFENKLSTRTFFVISFIVIALMIGLRHYSNGSTDTMFYCKNWIKLSKMSFPQFKDFLNEADMEKGYLLFAWSFSQIFPKYQALLIISGIFFAFSICSFLKKNCKNPMLGLLIFNCFGLFNFLVQGLRQGIAMCICLFAIEFYKKNKPIRFVIVVFIASLFHASAWIFLIVYFLRFLKITLPSFFLFITGGVIGFSLLPKVFEIMNTIINDEYEIGTASEEGGIITIAIYLVITFVTLFLYDKSKENEFYAMFFYMCCIAMTAMIMRNFVSSIVERIAHYFSFGVLVTVPNCIENIEDRALKSTVTIIVSLLFIILAIHKATYSTLVPYEFFWR